MKNAMNAIVLGLAVFGLVTLPLASCGLPFSIVNNQYKDDLGAVIWWKSPEDNNVVITMYPNVMLSPGGDTSDLKLGMIWTQSRADEILLVLARDTNAPAASNLSLDSLSVNIDGQVTRFKPRVNQSGFQGYNSVSKAAYAQGKASVRIPVDYMKKMINGRTVRVSAPGFDTALFHPESLLVGDESYLLLAKRTFKEALAEVSRETNTPLGFSIDHFDPMSS